MITLNLLPKEYHAGLRRDIILRMFTFAFVSLSVWTLAFFFLVAQGWVYLAIQNSALQQRLLVEQNTDAAKKISTLETNVKAINAALAYAEDINARPSDNAAVLMAAIDELVPAGVTLNVFDLNSSSRALTISGTAAKRDDVLAFEQKLRAQSQIIREVVAPLSNLFKPDNVQFSFFITLQSKAQ